MQIKVSSFEEDLPQSQFSPSQYAIATAREKAKCVASEAPDAKLVIAADTVRHYNSKPAFSPAGLMICARAQNVTNGHEAVHIM